MLILMKNRLPDDQVAIHIEIVMSGGESSANDDTLLEFEF